MESEMDADPHAEAERWYVRLRAADCTARERQAFALWRDADPGCAQAYADTEELWGAMDDLADDAEMLAWRSEARESVLRLQQKRRHWPLLAAAASVVFAVAIGLMLSGERYSTARGQQKSLTLADGSRLILNTDTAVRVHLRSGEREVELIRGEVLFEVVHDTNRPFRVRAGGDTITDIGTKFDVRRGEGWTKVGVLEGEVAVTGGGGQVANLGAGQQVRTGAGVWRRPVAEIENLTRWVEGRMAFHDTPLAEAVAEMNRYGPGRLVLADVSLSGLSVSGDFRIGEPDSLLRALQAAFPIRTEIRDGDIYLYRRH